MKRRKIRIASYIIAAFAVLGGVILRLDCQVREYKLQVDNSYKHAFTELSNALDNMTLSLEKSLYATGEDMISSVCTDVFGKAMTAQEALGQLPLYEYELENTAGFVAKVGDYSYTLIKNIDSDSGYTQQQYDTLKKLWEISSQLSQSITSLVGDVSDGTIPVQALSNADKEAVVLGDSFKTIESEFPEIPSLIYDGPFSEHITQMQPVYLEDKQNTSQQEAMESAADFLDIDRDELTFDGARAGNIEAYIFSCRINGAQKYIEVTKKGAIVLNLLSARQSEGSNISISDARKIALRFLEKKGYTSMAESYHILQDNVLTVNFAYSQDGVICYTDLIKVSVAMDNGEIMGFEALGYIMSHYDRTMPPVQVDTQKAQETVSPTLTVLSHEMAVIPTDGKYEVYCHEFKCQNENGQHVLVYINAVTGMEQKILILLENENGTLAI